MPVQKPTTTCYSDRKEYWDHDNYWCTVQYIYVQYIIFNNNSNFGCRIRGGSHFSSNLSFCVPFRSCQFQELVASGFGKLSTPFNPQATRAFYEVLGQVVREGRAKVLEGILFQLLGIVSWGNFIDLSSHRWRLFIYKKRVDCPRSFPNLQRISWFWMMLMIVVVPKSNFVVRNSAIVSIRVLPTSSPGSLCGPLCPMHMGFLFEPQAVECARCCFKSPGGHQWLGWKIAPTIWSYIPFILITRVLADTCSIF